MVHRASFHDPLFVHLARHPFIVDVDPNHANKCSKLCFGGISSIESQVQMKSRTVKNGFNEHFFAVVEVLQYILKRESRKRGFKLEAQCSWSG